MQQLRNTKPNGNESSGSNDALCLLGGAAMIAFGAGLILSTPLARRYLSNIRIATLLGGPFPDIERYMKMRAM